MLNLTLVSLSLRNQFASPSFVLQQHQNLAIRASLFGNYFDSAVKSYGLSWLDVTLCKFTNVLNSAIYIANQNLEGVTLTEHQECEKGYLKVDGCVFRKCATKSSGGGFHAICAKADVRNSAFINCMAGDQAGAYLWSGITGKFAANCISFCHAGVQSHAYIVQGNNTELNHTVVDFCRKSKKNEGAGGGLYQINGDYYGRAVTCDCNYTRSILNDVRACACYGYLRKLSFTHIIHMNLTTGKLLQTIGVGPSSTTGTLTFADSYVCYIKLPYTLRHVYLFDYEGHIVLRNMVFLKNSNQFKFVHKRTLDRHVKTSVDVFNCIFDVNEVLRNPEDNVNWGQGNKLKVSKRTAPPIEIDFENWKCRTENIPTKSQTPVMTTPLATPLPTPSDLPPPSIPPVEKQIEATKNILSEEEPRYSLGDVIQIGVLSLLCVIVVVVFIVAMKAKEKRIQAARNEDESALFLIKERNLL